MKPSPSSLLLALLLALTGIGTSSALDVTAQYWRFTQTKLRDGASANSIQMSEFDLLHAGTRIAGAVASNPGGNSPGGQGAAQAVDSSVTTKWLDFNRAPLVLTFPAPVTVDGYRFATGGDATERDPVSWIIESSSDNLTWSTVETRTDYPTPVGRSVYTPNILFLAPTPLTINLFATTRPKIGTGESASLYWSVAGSTSVSISPGIGTVTEVGSVGVAPSVATTYTLTATKGAEVLTATATVTPISRGPQTFQYFRFTPVALRQPTANSIQLAEFEMITGTTRLAGAVGTNPLGSNSADGGPSRAVDNVTTTKWLDFNKSALILNYGAPVSPDGYRFATANDFDERDPVSWTLEGSTNGSSWILLDTVSNFPAPLGRFTYSGDVPLNSLLPPTVTFTASDVHLQPGGSTTLTWTTTNAATVNISPPVAGGSDLNGTVVLTPPAGISTYSLAATNAAGTTTRTVSVYVEGPVVPVTYQYFRFTQTALRDGAAANSIQLAEFELSLAGVRVTGATATNPGGSNPGGQEPSFAADGDLGTKWLDFNRAPLVYSFPGAVTIDGYRIGTGGDAPERDPFAWKLEGSSNGTTWTVIDTRSIGFVIPAARGAYTNYFRFPGPAYAPIAASNYSAATSSITITFTSETGRTYLIESSTDLATWTTAMDNIAATGTSTVQTVPATGSRMLFRVMQKP